MEKPTIRRATPQDLPGIVALLADDMLGRQRESLGPPLDPCYAQAFAAIDNDPNQLLAVVDDGTADGAGVIGCLQVTFIPGISLKGMWRGQIEGVRIAAALRGRGLGHRMIEWAVEQCRRRGCGMVQLTMNKSREDTLRFYQSLGFEATHEGFKLML